MSIKVMTWVWENGPADQGQRLVLLALADFSDDDGRCWPSMCRIAAKAAITERGARGIVRRLEADGWISVAIGGGRSGCNQYVLHAVNPERQTRKQSAETRNDKPGKSRNPEPETGKMSAETRNVTTETRNQRSAEPSRTIKEPSEEERARVRLAPILGEELADDWIAHRREKKRPVTERGAKALASELAALPDPCSAVRQAIANGWQGVVFKNPNIHPFPQKGPTRGERYRELSAELDARLAAQPFE